MPVQIRRTYYYNGYREPVQIGTTSYYIRRVELSACHSKRIFTRLNLRLQINTKNKTKIYSESQGFNKFDNLFE